LSGALTALPRAFWLDLGRGEGEREGKGKGGKESGKRKTEERKGDNGKKGKEMEEGRGRE